MQAFVDRFRYKASKARQAQSRLKALGRLEPIVLAAEEAPAHIAFPDPLQLNPPLIALDRVAVGYVAGKPVLSRLELRLEPGDGIALLGAHGEGKPAQARLLARRRAAVAGRWYSAPRLARGCCA